MKNMKCIHRCRNCMLITTALLFGAQFSIVSAVEEWSYEGPTGPANWTVLGDTSCNASLQSPINIVTSSVVYDSALASLDISSYSKESTNERITVSNNGHSINIGFTYQSTPTYTIKNGGLNYTYILDGIHFHWGTSNRDGSEHTVDGITYPMEAHFVHYRQDLGSVTNRRNKSDGLAVLSVLLTVSTSNTPHFDFLYNLLSNVSYKGQSVILPTKFMPSTLIPNDHSIIYRYQGSLTTPPCDESVIWTVFKTTHTINDKQLAHFRDIYETAANETAGHHLLENHRPVQDLHSRKVTTNDIKSGISIITSSLVTLLGSITIVLFL